MLGELGKSRVASVYLLMLMGAMAIGGAIWGALAQYVGLNQSLLLAALTLVIGLLLTNRSQLELGQEADYALAQPTDKLVLATQVDHKSGPVSIEIGYRVLLAERESFLDTVYAVGQARRRNGVQNWRLYRDVTDDEHYVERFIVESWLDYLRQHTRITQADQQRELRLSGFRCDGEDTRRYIHQPRGSL